MANNPSGSRSEKGRETDRGSNENRRSPNGPATATQSAHETVETVRDAAQEIGRNLRDAAQERVEDLRGKAGQYVEAGRGIAADLAEQGRDVAHQYMEQGRDRALDMERSLEAQIRDQPLRAVLTAAGVGFVLGILFSRR